MPSPKGGVIFDHRHNAANRAELEDIAYVPAEG